MLLYIVERREVSPQEVVEYDLVTASRRVNDNELRWMGKISLVTIWTMSLTIHGLPIASGRDVQTIFCPSQLVGGVPTG